MLVRHFLLTTINSKVDLAVEASVSSIKLAPKVLTLEAAIKSLVADVAALPNPNEVLAVAPLSNTKVAPSPTIIPPLVTSKSAIAAKLALYACTSVPIVNPDIVTVPLDSSIVIPLPWVNVIVSPNDMSVELLPSLTVIAELAKLPLGTVPSKSREI